VEIYFAKSITISNNWSR